MWLVRQDWHCCGVSTKIAELGLNIDDISQTVLDEYSYHDGGRF